MSAAGDTTEVIREEAKTKLTNPEGVGCEGVVNSSSRSPAALLVRSQSFQ